MKNTSRRFNPGVSSLFLQCCAVLATAFVLLVLAVVKIPYTFGQTPLAKSSASQSTPELRLGQTVKGELAPGQTLRYAVRIEAGSFVRFEMIVANADPVISSLDSGAQLTLYDAAGTIIYQEWHAARKQAEGFRQQLKRVIEIEGVYQIEAIARPAQKTPALYQFKIAELRPATEADRTLQSAEVQQLKALELLTQRKDFDEAIALGEAALATYLKLLPPDNGDIGNLGIVLVNLYTERGYHRDIGRREQILEIAAQNREAMFGPDNLHVAILYEWLAEAADPVRAERWYQKTMEIVVKNVGSEHSYVASVLNSLGTIVEALGDKIRAAEMYERAVRMMEKTEGPEHAMLCAPLTNYGQALMDKKEWTAAETCFQRVLSIVEKNPVGTHMEGNPRALALYSLVELFQRKGDFAQADACHQKLLEHHKATGQLPHQHVWATAYQQKGNHAIARGKYDDAERSFEQARKVLEMTGDSPAFASLLRDWRKLYLLTGRINDAIAAQRRAVEMSETELNRLLAYGSERDKMKVLSLAAEEMAETLSLHIQSAPESSEAMRLAFTTLLQRKGRVLDEMNRTIALLRLSAKGQDAELIEQWINKASQISVLASRTTENEDPAGQLAKIDKLNLEYEQLQNTISNRSAVFRVQVLPPVTLDDVRRELPPRSALVEFAQYQPEDARTKQKSPPRYLAYVLPREGEVRWVELGEVSKIDAAVQSLRQAISDQGIRADPRPAARKLDELVMRPIRPLLGQARTVFLSPDGELNLAPFAALRDERGRYLIEDYLFIYLTSGRDLLRLKVKHESQPDQLIFAVSDFDGQVVAGPAETKSSAVSDVRGGLLSADATMATIRFDRLTAARAEGEAVRRAFPQAKLYADWQALETSLKQVRRPYFLHLVTHGFFLPDGEQKLENPLLRSGLAFAGANQRRSGDDDGLLTAFEAAALDLWGTKLVVLSACETGVGAVKNGEGVFGLRRALVLAGAETQVASLWLASDLATRKLMQNFYGKLNSGLGRAEALRQTQLEMLRGRPVNRAPYYWANFICIGEWKPLDK